MSVAYDRSKPSAVLLGGTSAEREISLLSGRTVVDALKALGHAVRAIDPADADWIEQLRGVRCAFNALHGPGGEDGSMQGALGMLGGPFTGSGVLGSALAMDKLRSKQLWQGVGIATGGFEVLAEDTDWAAVIERYGKVFVKPACEGSSIGMSAAADPAALRRAYEMAASYQGAVIAEQYIDGPEYTVAILGEEALPAIRLETDNEFYDYEAKYLSDDTRYLCPCGLDAAEEAAIADLALRAFGSLGCAVWGRVDLMRDSDGCFYVLEVNTIPGMTSHSLVPMAAAAAGLDVNALVGRILQRRRQVDDAQRGKIIHGFHIKRREYENDFHDATTFLVGGMFKKMTFRKGASPCRMQNPSCILHPGCLRPEPETSLRSREVSNGRMDLIPHFSEIIVQQGFKGKLVFGLLLAQNLEELPMPVV